MYSLLIFQLAITPLMIILAPFWKLVLFEEFRWSLHRSDIKTKILIKSKIAAIQNKPLASVLSQS